LFALANEPIENLFALANKPTDKLFAKANEQKLFDFLVLSRQNK
jgi:hypothetical protein